jgi:hypothetical protein
MLTWRAGSSDAGSWSVVMGGELTELQRWDTFYYLALTDDEREGLDDSWG